MLTQPTAELPAVLIDRGRHRRVERIQDSWRLDDEWWRDRLSRRYYQLFLEDGTLCTVYQDLVDGRWYRQHY